MSRFSGLFFKLFISTVLITSCGKTNDIIDVSDVQLSVPVMRLDQELFDKSEPMKTKLPQLTKEYGEFFARYTEDMLNLGAIGDPTLPGAFKQFVYDTDISKVAADVNSKYGDFSVEQKKIEVAFKRYKILFPKKEVPTVVTIISGFTYKIAATQKTIGVGLDMYLGTDYPYYNALQFPAYRKNTLERKFIPSDVLTGWVSTEFVKPDSANSMLDEIIHEGKILYLLDRMFPHLSDEIKIGYLPEQFKWCQENEMAMWGHFVNEKILFSRIKGDFFKFITDGPFTAGFDRASPARTGNWIGWQIVRSYMESNPEITELELMNNTNAQGILNASNYKPKK